MNNPVEWEPGQLWMDPITGVIYLVVGTRDGKLMDLMLNKDTPLELGEAQYSPQAFRIIREKHNFLGNIDVEALSNGLKSLDYK